jgi:hypothetical protein
VRRRFEGAEEVPPDNTLFSLQSDPLHFI